MKKDNRIIVIYQIVDYERFCVAAYDYSEKMYQELLNKHNLDEYDIVIEQGND